jgi:hypothetical protein
MFDLDKAVNDWCEKVMSHNIWDADKVDELKDHLYCIIEEDIKAGTSEQVAFENATNVMGYPEAKLDDTSSRARIVQGVCRVLSKIEGHPYSDSPLVIAHAAIWACVMLAMALVIKDKDVNGNVLMILTMGWFASFVALDGMKRSAKEEWACLKRKIVRKFS